MQALRYVIQDIDRHGNVRFYVVRKGQSKIRLYGDPGSEAFLTAYRSALAGIHHKTEPTPSRSFKALCEDYWDSPTFKPLDISTRAWRRRELLSACQSIGDINVTLIKPDHIRKLRDERIDKPGSANNRLKALKALFRWAIDVGKVRHDPTRDIRKLQYVTAGHHSWTKDDVTRFENHHPIGTKARLAMALMLYTACRREDVVRLGPSHIHAGWLTYTQAKNEDRNPITLTIPIHPNLAKIIKATRTGRRTFLITDYGQPFTCKGFGHKFRDWCDQAGLHQCSAHGLRKAMATRLAEAGATVHEIMAITGHRTLSEVERYTQAAQQNRLADTAMAKLI